MNLNSVGPQRNQLVKPKGEIIVTDNGKKYQKVGIVNAAGAVIVAKLAGQATNKAVRKLCRFPLKNLKELTKDMDADTFKQAADKAFKNSGLREKGVKIIDATEENKNLLKDIVEKIIPKCIKNNPTAKKIYDKKIEKLVNTITSGNNAGYIPRANVIFVNKDKMSWATFHEMGHALNKKMGGIGKVLAKTRHPMALLSSIAILTAMFKRKKADGEKPQGFFDKTTTFIKENAGKLAFIGTIPTLLEEGLASIKGAKLAKEVLSPENYKKVKNLNARAYVTYIGMAVATGLSAYVISKVRDAIAAPQEIK